MLTDVRIEEEFYLDLGLLLLTLDASEILKGDLLLVCCYSNLFTPIIAV